MVIDPENSRILIYADCSRDIEYERIPIELLSSLDVILLGIYPVPDQATPEQTRDNFGDAAEKTLQKAIDRFSLSDVDPNTVIKFTSDPIHSINKVATAKNCDAILTPGKFQSLDQLLIPIKGTENAEAMSTFICDLLRESPKNVTLIGFVTADSNESNHRSHLEQFENSLVAGGINADKVELRMETVEDVETALAREIADYDLAILGESEPQIEDVVMENVHKNMLDQTAVPIITIRFPNQEGHQQQMRSNNG